MVILIAVIVIPRFYPNKISEEENQKLREETELFFAEMDKASNNYIFYFDPNTINTDSLVLLGFSTKQALAIINYRENYGKFYSKESFGQLYVVSDKMYSRLYNYIDIGSEKRSSSHSQSKLDINSADSASLLKLKGIGPQYARNIIEYRNKLGGFYNVQQLTEIKGIGAARYAQIYNHITVDSAKLKQININTITERQLGEHPYISVSTAKRIIKYREQKGKITSATELYNEQLISEHQLLKLSPYLRF